MCSNRIAALALAGVMVLGLVACSPTDPEPTDTSTPEVTEPADTSEPEQTAPAEPDDQEPQETAGTTADTETTEMPSQETPSAETPVPEPVQQPTQEQQQETQTPVIPSDGGGNPDSSAGNDAGQTSGNQGGSGDTGGNSSSVNEGDEAVAPNGRPISDIVNEGLEGHYEQKDPNDKTIDELIDENGWEVDGDGGIIIP